jgi:hypothetical protein
LTLRLFTLNNGETATLEESTLHPVLHLREGMQIFVKTLTGKMSNPWPDGCISD